MMSMSSRLASVAVVTSSLVLGLNCAAAQGISRDFYSSEMNKALDNLQSSAARGSSAKERLRVHANLFLAHEAFIADTPLDVLKGSVDAFKEAGIWQVDLNMGLFPWVGQDKAAIDKYDAIVAYIRSAGM